MLERLQSLEIRFEALGRELSDPEVLAKPWLLQDKGRQHSELESVVRLIRQYRELLSHLSQAEELTHSEKDLALLEMARQERDSLKSRQAILEAELHTALLPKDPNDQKDVLLEIRAGAGGEEAALFAGELLRLYTRFCERHRWKVELESLTHAEAGGIKEAILTVSGIRAYPTLKHEAGVHRVQRVPVTEANGRVHTSTASVIVMPEVEEREIKIDEKDLKWEVFCASGHGGQSVNTTYSAVRVTHLPSGVVVSMQDERKQLKNRQKAMKILATRLAALEKDRLEAQNSADRKSQVKAGDRSEKIRTYNFPQNRVTDHRVGISSHDLPSVMDGNVDVFSKALVEAEKQQKLAELAPA